MSELNEPVSPAIAAAESAAAQVRLEPARAVLPLRTLLALPLSTTVTLAVHWAISGKQSAAEARVYSIFLGAFVAMAALSTIGLSFFYRLRKVLAHYSPLFAAAMLSLCGWEVMTTGLRWLPLPYFPGPAAVLASLVNDRQVLIDSTWHSALLLVSGYLLGTAAALVTGVCIGWSARARYWGMPLLKIIGPIPATAWVPLAMVVSPSGVLSAMGLIALSVWFPVTMLTASGIANTRASYLDVARTLGASERYLIFRVAVPAAMPSIFIGLFMGLGTSFLTLIVAETVGVKSGLGWYVSWAQGWAEYGKVYAALVIMAAFFSTIISLLFKLRDRVLAWQKGSIKW